MPGIGLKLPQADVNLISVPLETFKSERGTMKLVLVKRMNVLLLSQQLHRFCGYQLIMVLLRIHK